MAFRNGHGISRELAPHYTALDTVTCIDIKEKNYDKTVKKAKRLKNAGSLADQIKDEIGLVFVMENSVRIMPTHRFEQQIADEIRQVFETNVISQFWTLQAFLPHMKQQNRGHIIAMHSIAGLMGNAHFVSYYYGFHYISVYD
uniref:Uncharacterized protein n=1 Tax=Glossina pallidipes TaxID=7398 RepID=A0A1B0ABT6_GLOPL